MYFAFLRIGFLTAILLTGTSLEGAEITRGTFGQQRYERSMNRGRDTLQRGNYSGGRSRSMGYGEARIAEPTQQVLGDSDWVKERQDKLDNLDQTVIDSDPAVKMVKKELQERLDKIQRREDVQTNATQFDWGYSRFYQGYLEAQRKMNSNASTGTSFVSKKGEYEIAYSDVVEKKNDLITLANSGQVTDSFARQQLDEAVQKLFPRVKNYYTELNNADDRYSSASSIKNSDQGYYDELYQYFNITVKDFINKRNYVFQLIGSNPSTVNPQPRTQTYTYPGRQTLNVDQYLNSYRNHIAYFNDLKQQGYARNQQSQLNNLISMANRAVSILTEMKNMSSDPGQNATYNQKRAGFVQLNAEYGVDYNAFIKQLYGY